MNWRSAADYRQFPARANSFTRISVIFHISLRRIKTTEPSVWSLIDSTIQWFDKNSFHCTHMNNSRYSPRLRVMRIRGQRDKTDIFGNNSPLSPALFFSLLCFRISPESESDRAPISRDEWHSNFIRRQKARDRDRPLFKFDHTRRNTCRWYLVARGTQVKQNESRGNFPTVRACWSASQASIFLIADI